MFLMDAAMWTWLKWTKWGVEIHHLVLRGLRHPFWHSDGSPRVEQLRVDDEREGCLNTSRTCGCVFDVTCNTESETSIVGGTLREGVNTDLRTNFVSECRTSPHPSRYTGRSDARRHPSSHFSKLYRSHHLLGGHIIKLGPGNDDAAKEALSAWPGHLQLGGGINQSNAQHWLDAGASKVIVTSYLFPDARFDRDRLVSLSEAVGREHLVIDVSCRRKGSRWIVAMNKWQDLTDMEVNKESLALLSAHCSEFLVHAADVEGLCQGIDEELVACLGKWCTIPVTYAGGAKALGDLRLVDRLSEGRVDLTFGSSLDIFGGTQVVFDDLVRLDSGGQ